MEYFVTPTHSLNLARGLGPEYKPFTHKLQSLDLLVSLLVKIVHHLVQQILNPLVDVHSLVAQHELVVLALYLPQNALSNLPCVRLF